MTNLLKSLTSIPADIVTAQDYEALAQRFIPAPTYAYIAGGSAQDETLAANRAAFSQYVICPRLLRDLSSATTHTIIAGKQFAHPILLAPVAYQRLVHPGGEIDSARAAAATDSTLILSTLSSHSLEDVAAATPANKWFQLYFQPVREHTLDLVKRAEAAGYSALVVTLDASIQVPSRRAQHAGFYLPPEISAVNLRSYCSESSAAAPAKNIFSLLRNAPNWQDLQWLQAQTKLPIWVKGVLHPEDAKALKALGITGIVVSNHGGRGLDGVATSMQMLPLIRGAVGAEFPLLLDSGIRSGKDIFKALALGADGVLIGRLQIYALSVAGALGVAHMMKLLREELEVCMAMAGCSAISDIDTTYLMPAVSAPTIGAVHFSGE
ncbi:alpha-hydroxy acid oxidase [Cellvibrio sp. OA-2007]|uniref:alpha-hydroxy acid oxidase n=1 Tax=Cellvibrio sp. OA-2007 TaxID=529823 RepID=UPI0009FF9F25|nr:alpha-hydroxy acid oxidase [Cellvibrio sp. OA-2007]